MFTAAEHTCMHRQTPEITDSLASEEALGREARLERRRHGRGRRRCRSRRRAYLVTGLENHPHELDGGEAYCL